MADLISYAQYKILTNTTDDTNDTNQTLIEQLITLASLQIETFCDRTFAATTHYEWLRNTSCLQTIVPKEYPIIKVLLVGACKNVLDITDSSTSKSYTISVNNNKMYITDETLATEEYDLTDPLYDTLAELETAIEADWSDLSVVVETDAIQSSKTLVNGIYGLDNKGTTNILGVEQSSVEIKILDDILYCNGKPDLIVYQAGYATIPLDLQNVCAMVVKDSLNVALGEQNSSVKSESISAYSYTLSDTVDFNSIVNSYATALSAYKNIRI